MRSKELKKYFKSQTASFEKHYKEIIKHRRKKDIHAFRIAIKRIRIFLWFMEVVTDGAFRKKDHYLMLSKLFKVAGRVREIQLNLQLINTFDQNKHEYAIKNYTESLKKYNQQFVDELHRFPYKRFQNMNMKLAKRINSISDKAYIKAGHELLRRELKNMRRLNKKNQQIRDLHTMRIHLRRAREIINILRQSNVFEIPGQIRKDLSLLYEYLGLWHDHYVLLYSLKSIRKNKHSAKNNRLLSPTIKTARQREEILRNDLKLQIDQHISILNQHTNKKKITISS